MSIKNSTKYCMFASACKYCSNKRLLKPYTTSCYGIVDCELEGSGERLEDYVTCSFLLDVL